MLLRLPFLFFYTLSLLPIILSFSGGGGEGAADDGTPLLQSCDAINLCNVPCFLRGNGRPCYIEPISGFMLPARRPGSPFNLDWPAQDLHLCPGGMTYVAPPVRSAVYNLTASSATYTPGELLHLELRA